MGIVNASTLRVQAVGQTHTVKMPHYLTFVCIHQILPPNQNWDGATPMLFGFAPIKEPFGCFFHLNIPQLLRRCFRPFAMPRLPGPDPRPGIEADGAAGGE